MSHADRNDDIRSGNTTDTDSAVPNADTDFFMDNIDDLQNEIISRNYFRGNTNENNHITNSLNNQYYDATNNENNNSINSNLNYRYNTDNADPNIHNNNNFNNNGNNNVNNETNRNNLNNMPLLGVRDRLFHALFFKASLTYARAVPSSVRRVIEFLVLLKVKYLYKFLQN